MHQAFMVCKATKLSFLIIFIAVLFIQIAANRSTLYAIGSQQNSTVKANNTKFALFPLLSEANSLNKIFKQAKDSIVTIIRTLPSPTTVTPQSQNTSVLESGFLYDNQGHIITNNHAIGDTIS